MPTSPSQSRLTQSLATSSQPVMSESLHPLFLHQSEPLANGNGGFGTPAKILTNGVDTNGKDAKMTNKLAVTSLLHSAQVPESSL